MSNILLLDFIQQLDLLLVLKRSSTELMALLGDFYFSERVAIVNGFFQCLLRNKLNFLFSQGGKKFNCLLIAGRKCLEEWSPNI